MNEWMDTYMEREALWAFRGCLARRRKQPAKDKKGKVQEICKLFHNILPCARADVDGPYGVTPRHSGEREGRREAFPRVVYSCPRGLTAPTRDPRRLPQARR